MPKKGNNSDSKWKSETDWESQWSAPSRRSSQSWNTGGAGNSGSGSVWQGPNIPTQPFDPTQVCWKSKSGHENVYPLPYEDVPAPEEEVDDRLPHDLLPGDDKAKQEKYASDVVNMLRGNLHQVLDNPAARARVADLVATQLKQRWSPDHVRQASRRYSKS